MRLTASDTNEQDAFGISVAVSGDTAVVGAAVGAAYVFRRDEGSQDSWGELKRLTASDAQAGDSFGWSVAVSGDTAVLGTRTGDAAFVFQRNQSGTDNWGEVTKLTASDAQFGDSFGFSVAVSADTAIVGAWTEDAGGSFSGAAYVFQRNEGGADNWGEVKKLTASDAEADAYFGQSVAVSADTAIVGAFGESAGGTQGGAAYVFQRNEGGADNWGEVKKLTASDAQAFDQFGGSAAVSGDTAVVGTRNGDAAYVFQRNEGGADNWGEVTKLTASDAQAGDSFGWSVAVSADTAVVGAWFADFPGFGGTNVGAAYSFQRDQGGADTWGEVAKLTASDAWANDFFGGSVAVSGDTAVVGAESAGDTHQAGAAYVFDLLGMKSAPAGDANCDGTVNAVDAAVILQFSAGLLESLPCADGGDVNGDGNINALDAALILQFTAGLLGSLPP